jgi:hypothetical protein
MAARNASSMVPLDDDRVRLVVARRSLVQQ